MRCVVQRVKWAKVEVEGALTGQIGPGFLALVGCQEGDGPQDMGYILDKLCTLRLFEDEQGKMNLSIGQVGGAILLVSQFTLLGDGRHGRRPSFSHAARPELAQPMLDQLAQGIRDRGIPVSTGKFQAHMEVSLLNDGPVTLLLDSKKKF